MPKTYSLNDLGVTADDLIMLDASGYRFDETDNISEEKRDEILNKLYDLKHKEQQKPSEERKAPEIEPATDEQLKDMNYRLGKGEHLSAQEVASAVARGGIVSKAMRAEIKNTITDFANTDNANKEDATAVSYLLDEINGKHATEKSNAHSVHEYRKQFDGNDEVLDLAAKKLENATKAPSAAIYSKEDLDALLKQGEIYLKKPEEIEGREVLEKAVSNYKEVHQELFAQHLGQVSSLIKDYAEGRATIAPDAIESMEKVLDTYGREYSKGTISKDMSYDITQDAANAHQQLAHDKKVFAQAPVKAEIKEEPTNEVQQPVTTEEKDDKKDVRQAVRNAHKKAGKDRTVEDWKLLYAQIDNNPNLVTEKDKEKARKRLDEDFERTANKGVKKAFDEEKKKEVEAQKPVETQENNPQEQKKEQKDTPVTPLVAPVIIDTDNVHDASQQSTEKPQEQKKEKKKGFWGKVVDWGKRNLKKVAIGGAILAASLFGAKSCNGNQQQDNNGSKDKQEVVAPTSPQQGEKIVVTDKESYDIEMAHQYCKRMGYQTQESEGNIDARFFRDRMTYEVNKNRVAGHLGIDTLSIDQQMAILATVRGNTPANAPVIDAILNGREPGEDAGYNVATLAKLRKETSKFTVRAEDGTIQYTNPEKFTKQTGSQSASVSKDTINKKGTELGFTAAHHSNYRGGME